MNGDVVVAVRKSCFADLERSDINSRALVRGCLNRGMGWNGGVQCSAAWAEICVRGCAAACAVCSAVEGSSCFAALQAVDF